MGWSSWNVFACGQCGAACTKQPVTSLNESTVKGMADAMANSGLLAAGYEYGDTGFELSLHLDSPLSRNSQPQSLKLLYQ